MADLRPVRHGLIAVYCILVISSLSACAHPAENAPQAALTTIESSNLTEIADQLARGLNSSYSTTFAGVEIDSASHHVIVYRKPDSKLDDAVNAVVRDRSVIILRPAKFSASEMRDTQSQIMADADKLAGLGIALTGVIPKQNGAGVVVIVHPGTSSGALPVLREKFGDIVLAVKEQEVHFSGTDVRVTSNPLPTT